MEEVEDVVMVGGSTRIPFIRSPPPHPSLDQDKKNFIYFVVVSVVIVVIVVAFVVTVVFVVIFHIISFIIIIRKLVSDFFGGKKLNVDIDPELAVITGEAVNECTIR